MRIPTTLKQYKCSFKINAKAKGEGSTKDTTLYDLFTAVTNNEVTKKLTAHVRKKYKEVGSGKEVDKLKEGLMACYPCAQFEGSGTRYNTLIAFSGIYVADVEQTTLGALKKDRHVLAYHKSSTAKGYAVYFKVPNLGSYSDERKETFKRIGKSILSYLTTRYGLKVDPLVDATRARYIAHDSQLFINTKSVEFPYNKEVSKEMRYADLITYVGEANARGVAKEVVLDKLNISLFKKSTSIKSQKDIEEAVNKIYTTYADQHNTSKDKEDFYPELKEYLCNKYKVFFNTIEEDFTAEINNQTINDYDKLLSLIQADVVTSFKRHISKETLNSMLVAYCTTEYNPFINYFESLPSGKGQISKLAKCFTVDISNKLFQGMLTKWLVQSVKCLLEPDFVNRYCFVLYGGQQIGKSTFARWLAVKPEWYTEEQLAFGDKDSRLLICRKWIANLEELNKDYNKRDVNELKALISSASVNVRESYGRKARTRNRICSFLGSTNKEKFLVDVDNTRWLVFRVLKIDWRYKQRVDINKLWAEVYALYKANYNYAFDEEETSYQQLINDTHVYIDREEDVLLSHYRQDEKSSPDNFISTLQLYEDLSYKYDRLDARKFYAAMYKLFGKSVQRRVQGKPQRGHYLIKVEEERPTQMKVSNNTKQKVK